MFGGDSPRIIVIACSLLSLSYRKVGDSDHLSDTEDEETRDDNSDSPSQEIGEDIKGKVVMYIPLFSHFPSLLHE